MTNEVTVSGGNQVATLEQYANNLQVKLQMAGTLLKSGLIPNHFRTPEAVLTAILYGQEIGLSPMQSVLSVTVIQGKPCLDAAGLKAKCLQHGGRFETITWTDKTCKLRGIRGDWKEEIEFTFGDAQKMGLAAKDNWTRMPKQMLYARAVSMLIRNMFADVIKGFYSKEEMLDSIDVTPAAQPLPQKLEEVVKPAEEIVDTGPHWYRLKDVAPAARKKALEYAEQSSAELLDSKELIFRSEKALPKLRNYEIEEPQIAEPAIETPLGEQIDGGAEIEGEEAA